MHPVFNATSVLSRILNPQSPMPHVEYRQKEYTRSRTNQTFKFGRSRPGQDEGIRGVKVYLEILCALAITFCVGYAVLWSARREWCSVRTKIKERKGSVEGGILRLEGAERREVKGKKRVRWVDEEVSDVVLVGKVGDTDEDEDEDEDKVTIPPCSGGGKDSEL
jgi:hypothetical protein